MHQSTNNESWHPDGRSANTDKLKFLLSTWAGRLLIINTAVFVYICIRTGSIFLPDMNDLEVIVGMGAKDPVQLAKGEYWRLFTPVFIHIGILHFTFNNLMLYVIGLQLEKVLGGAWFMAIYLTSGIAGNIASGVFSVQPSAGASGAIFGLLGCGFLLEWTIGRRIKESTGQKPRNRIYLSMVVMNLVFGFIVPVIDNAAHIGGLLAGVGMTAAMLNLRPNRISFSRREIGVALIFAILTCGILGSWLATSPDYQAGRLVKAAEEVGSAREKIHYYSHAIDIRPDDSDLRLERAALFLFSDKLENVKYALFDLRIVLMQPGNIDRVKRLADDLEGAGMVTQAWQVRRFLQHQDFTDGLMPPEEDGPE